LMQAHRCVAARLLEKIAALAQELSLRTQFCGRTHKLLPKASFTVVSSAPKKRSAASIETVTSSMRTEFLLRRTRMHFPLLEVADVRIRPIEKGGSDRKFYRIRCSANQRLILVKYNLEREENRHYVEIAKFLDTKGIRVPKIYFHDAAEGLIWIEDLGERDLYSYRHESWLVRRAFYESALDQIIKLHTLPESVSLKMKEHLPAEFDAALYRWEQRYFFNNSLGRYFSVNESTRKELMALAGLREIAKHLASLPRVLVHRDFQSQNIIIQNGQANLIDFQGMRPGLAEYDLASLLFDPYVELSGAERAELISYYRQKQAGNRPAVEGQFDNTLQLCAMQRLMQALGAYGFLGLVRGHEHFLEYIPKAVCSLREIVAKIDDLEPLASLLADL
jgi:N-acetylmuramate 1-kinase